MYAYQTDHIHTAQVADGLEDLLLTELEELGVTDCTKGFRFVRFHADHESLYRVVHRSRLATRVLTSLLHFTCTSDQALYTAGRDICWRDFLRPDQTFAIFANVSASAIGHSQYATLKLKDAVADWFRDHGGRRPNVDPRNPDLWLHLHIHENKATISLDVSGGSLHRRGYRTQSVAAPMQETVAAAIVRMSGWNGQSTLVDPLCGSGTILCEALMAGTDIPAAFLRQHFGFEHLPDFSAQLWTRVHQECTPKSDIPSLRGSDIDPLALAATRVNLANLPGGDEVVIGRRDFFDRDDLANTTIVCNPPYGLRLGRNDDMAAWFKCFGDHLKRRCAGSTAYVYFGDRTWLKSIGLRPEWKKPLKNGGLDGRLAKFSLY